MDECFHARGLWLARNVLPYEAFIRAKLRQIRIQTMDIDDIIQEMYARILTMPTLESIRFPRQYALQVAKSIVVDHIRHTKVVSIVSSGNLEQLNIALPGASTEELLEFQEEIQTVADALAELPAPCRETLILRRIEGLSQRETAQRLKISEKTVEKYMSRGVLMLMKAFGRGGKPKRHGAEHGTAEHAEETGSKDAILKSGD